MAIEGKPGISTVLAGTGKYSDLVGKNIEMELMEKEKWLITKAIQVRDCSSDGCQYAIYFSPDENINDVLLFSTSRVLSKDDMYLLRLFFNNVGVAYKNVLLNNELEETQREILYMLGEAIETRSKETGSHVRRVAEYSRLLGQKYGLSDRELELIMLASPLHDFGKIGIPDRILHKDGKLDDEEWEEMKTHSSLGEEMLKRSNREVMQAAALIAGQHHEWWNGSGYPRGLKGNDIHIYARITALADVYDALSSKRCYKNPWPLDKIYNYLDENSGMQFEPRLVDILNENRDEFISIQTQYPDH
jgi:response regulator RpfG family c-di-GMP phosphodiesterase